MVVMFCILLFFDWSDDDDCAIMITTLINRMDIRTLINIQDRWGSILLFIAAWRNNHRTIESLISQGADVNVRNKDSGLPNEDSDCHEETKKTMA